MANPCNPFKPKDCQGSLIIYITGAVAGLLTMAYIPLDIDRVSIVCMRDIHVQTADVFLTGRLENIGVPPPSTFYRHKSTSKE